jgi:transposase
MRKDRRNFTAREKVSILKEHLLEKMSVSEVCEKHKLQPTIFYRWQKQFFENGEKAFQFEFPLKPKTEIWQQQVAKLEDKLIKKHEVLSELMEEHLRLKKELGEL